MHHHHKHSHFEGECDNGNYIPSYSDFILALKNPNKIFKIETPICTYVLEFVCRFWKCSDDDNKDFLFKKVWKNVLRRTFSNEQKMCSFEKLETENYSHAFERLIDFVDELNIKIQKEIGQEEVGFDLKVYLPHKK